MKVLIVDDSETVRAYLKLYLDHKGHESFFARNGMEGLDVARIQKPDLIISDILMPIMDGFRFLSILREDPVIRDIPFIFFSGTYTDDKSTDLGLSLGADGYIKKSQLFENITEQLDSILNNVKQKRERATQKLTSSDKEFLEKYVEIMAVKLEKKVQELEELNRQIQEAAQSYEYLFNSIRDVIVVTDNEHCIIKYNMPIFHEIFGYNFGEINGSHLKVLFDNNDDFELLKKTVFDRRDYVHGKIKETSFKRKNGDVFKGEIKAMKFIGEHGIVSGDICMIRTV